MRTTETTWDWEPVPVVIIDGVRFRLSLLEYLASCGIPGGGASADRFTPEQVRALVSENMALVYYPVQEDKTRFKNPVPGPALAQYLEEVRPLFADRPPGPYARVTVITGPDVQLNLCEERASRQGFFPDPSRHRWQGVPATVREGDVLDVQAFMTRQRTPAEHLELDVAALEALGEDVLHDAVEDLPEQARRALTSTCLFVAAGETREAGSVLVIDGMEVRTGCGHSFTTCHAMRCYRRPVFEFLPEIIMSPPQYLLVWRDSQGMDYAEGTDFAALVAQGREHGAFIVAEARTEGKFVAVLISREGAGPK